MGWIRAAAHLWEQTGSAQRADAGCRTGRIQWRRGVVGMGRKTPTPVEPGINDSIVAMDPGGAYIASGGLKVPAPWPGKRQATRHGALMAAKLH